MECMYPNLEYNNLHLEVNKFPTWHDASNSMEPGSSMNSSA